MSIQVFNIGTASSVAGATVSITGVSVPAGAMIFVATIDKNVVSSVGLCSDSVGNNYIIGNSSSIGTVTNGQGIMSYALNVRSLNGGTITYTKGVSGVYSAITAVYAIGLKPGNSFDDNSTTQNFFTSSTPNSTNFPLFPGELIIDFVVWVAGAGDTFTQDIINLSPQWVSLPNQLIDSANAAGIAGGYIIDPLADTPQWEPTLNNSRSWGVFGQGFQAGPPPHDDVSLGANDA